MASFNKVILLGNLTRDPQVRYIQSGSAVTELGLAVNRSWYDKQSNQRKEEVTFIDVTLWGRDAEIAGEYLSKGRPVLIEGRLTQDRWDDKETGQKRSKLKVIAESMQLLGGRQEGAQVLIGGERNNLPGELAGGYYIKPTVFKGHNKMRIFQEEIFGPVVSVTTFKDDAEALAIANDTLYGLGAGVWTRDVNRAYRFGRSIQAGRVWTNCYHAYPAHAAFGGYKQSGIGRENHRMMLNHYQQTKNMLVSYSPKKLGFF